MEWALCEGVEGMRGRRRLLAAIAATLADRFCDRRMAGIGPCGAWRSWLHSNTEHARPRNKFLCTPNMSTTQPAPKYTRILLKLSGEVMAGEEKFGIDPGRVNALAAEVAEVAAAGIQIGVVVGGGNFFRGVAAAARKMDRVTADHM